jgi:hypothetical protein
MEAVLTVKTDIEVDTRLLALRNTTRMITPAGVGRLEDLKDRMTIETTMEGGDTVKIHGIYGSTTSPCIAANSDATIFRTRTWTGLHPAHRAVALRQEKEIVVAIAITTVIETEIEIATSTSGQEIAAGPLTDKAVPAQDVETGLREMVAV